MISSDGEVIEVKKENTEAQKAVKDKLVKGVEKALKEKKPKTKKIVTDDNKVVEVVDDKPKKTKKVVNADNEVVEVEVD